MSIVVLMPLVRSALVESSLARIVDDEPPLIDEIQTLLTAQLTPLAASTLPSIAVLCAALDVPLSRAKPAASDRLPARIVAGVSMPIERMMWRECQASGLHELLSREFVGELALHLSSAVERCHRAGVAQPMILEIGAGSGSLAFHLTLELRRLGHPFPIVATDDASSGITTVTSGIATMIDGPVCLTCADALARFAPHIVLVSWMPLGVDWSAAIRECESVREYVLLGDPTACGDTWATWGEAPLHAEEYGLSDDSVSPWESDGFVSARLEHIELHQLCRFDSSVARGFSSAFAFGRWRSLCDACDDWPVHWCRAPHFSGEPADVSWAEMKRETRRLVAEGELKWHGGVGGAHLCARLAFRAAVSETGIACNQRAALQQDEYYVIRTTEEGVFRVHGANSCQPGFRFLLTRGPTRWFVLQVTDDNGSTLGGELGVGVAHVCSSSMEPFLLLDEPHSCICFRQVALL